MSGWDSVGDIRWRSGSGGGDEDISKLIRCVNEREPQIHKVWNFSEDDVTCEVRPTAQVDVSAVFVGEFATNYLTPSCLRIPKFFSKFH